MQLTLQMGLSLKWAGAKANILRLYLILQPRFKNWSKFFFASVAFILFPKFYYENSQNTLPTS